MTVATSEETLQSSNSDAIKEWQKPALVEIKDEAERNKYILLKKNNRSPHGSGDCDKMQPHTTQLRKDSLLEDSWIMSSKVQCEVLHMVLQPNDGVSHVTMKKIDHSHEWRWNLDPRGLDPSKDLPLLANTAEIRVRHYLLDLEVNFENETFTGSLLIFLEPASVKEKQDGISSCAGRKNKKEESCKVVTTENVTRETVSSVVTHTSCKKETIIRERISTFQRVVERESELFTCSLDSCDIDVEKVEEVNFDRNQSKPNHDEKRQFGVVSETILSELLGYDRSNFDERNRKFESCRHSPGSPLPFRVDDWSLRIWKEGVSTPGKFPAVVRVVYRTRSRGHSLTWAFDQAGRKCVFSQGASINNRSLFPCQDPPGAMATWQAFVRAPAECVVLMSGDAEADRRAGSNGLVTSYYFVNMVMPPSLLALAVGQWQGVRLSTDLPMAENGAECFNIKKSSNIRSCPCHHEPWPCRANNYSQRVIPSQIYAPKSILEAAEEELGACIPRFLEASFKILGPHPFARLDFVILPYCFASMGLASPSMVFISNTLLAGDGSLTAQLAHEISHSWFGLLIGAKDPTEEWLSEGFATYLEDPIQALAEKWSKANFFEMSNLRALLRCRALRNEMKNTASELQIMRPMGGQPHMKEPLQTGYVKNGQNPDKWYLQVHYLKGYFLLHYLADVVGGESLLRVMAAYVTTYHGQLVLSEEFFKLLFEMCPTLAANGITSETINRDWLDAPGMPQLLDPERFRRGNKLILHVIEEVETWTAVSTYHRWKDKTKMKKKLKVSCPVPDLELIPEQVCLLLEHLIELDASLHVRMLARLKDNFRLNLRNAEIRHRWCELVIKHRYLDGYGDIRMFLLKDQSMGVYLYGELLASEDPVQRLLAETCYEAVVSSMDRGCRRTVEEMMDIDQDPAVPN